MIKAVVLDVDGVIVGKKKGVNFPNPHRDVVNFFKEIRGKGIPLILCTGKFSHAIKSFVVSANLDNPHITDGGSLILNFLNNKIIKKHVIDKQTAKEITKKSLEKNLFIELVTDSEYYVQKGSDKSLLKKRILILQKDPISVDSILETADKEQVIKIIFVLKNSEEKIKAENILKDYRSKINFIWSSHPSMDSITFCIITKPNVSKKNAALEVLDYLGIPADETLGVGDILSDWHFMEGCGFTACPKNAADELKKLVLSKKGFIGPSVDENGIIEIINRFLHE